MLEKGRIKGNMNLDDKEVLAGLNVGECLEAEMRDDEDEVMFKAKICKTKDK